MLLHKTGAGGATETEAKFGADVEEKITREEEEIF